MRQPDLSFDQRKVLAEASFDKPIYAAPNPYQVTGLGGHFCGPSVTVRSLVRRGLLTPDGKMGFVLTAAGEQEKKRTPWYYK